MGCAGSKPDDQARPEDVLLQGSSKARVKRGGVFADSATDTEGTYRRVVHEKSDEAKAMIRAATAENALFISLSEGQLLDVVDAMFETTFQPGEPVIRQGEQGDNFYVVDSGEYDVFLEQAGTQPVHAYKAGGAFGELALLYNCPRAASIVTRVGGSLWALDRDTFRRILLVANKAAFDLTSSFLKSVPLLSPLTEAQRCVR